MPRKLILILAAVIPFGVYIIAKRIYWSYYRMPTAYNYTTEDYMRATAEIQGSLSISEDDTVFVGDSHTSHFPLTEMFGSRYKNRGIGSNQTSHILNRIKPIAAARPSVIFLEGGYNDISAGKPVNQAFENYKQIIGIIHKTSPSTRLIIQSVFPVCKGSLKFMPGVDSLNMLLKDYCRVNSIDFLDLNPLFKVGNKLDTSATWDGIHLTFDGYKRWYDTVRHFLR
jgi:lysophospholipase L1-like esterase